MWSAAWLALGCLLSLHLATPVVSKLQESWAVEVSCASRGGECMEPGGQCPGRFIDDVLNCPGGSTCCLGKVGTSEAVQHIQDTRTKSGGGLGIRREETHVGQGAGGYLARVTNQRPSKKQSRERTDKKQSRESTDKKQSRESTDKKQSRERAQTRSRAESTDKKQSRGSTDKKQSRESTDKKRGKERIGKKLKKRSPCGRGYLRRTTSSTSTNTTNPSSPSSTSTPPTTTTTTPASTSTTTTTPTTTTTSTSTTTSISTSSTSTTTSTSTSTTTTTAASTCVREAACTSGRCEEEITDCPMSSGIALFCGQGCFCCN